MPRKVLYMSLVLIMIFSFFQGKTQMRDSTKQLTAQEKNHFNIVIQFHSGSGYIKKFIESGKMSEDVEWFVPGQKAILPFAGLWKGVAGITEFSRLLDSTMRYDKVEIKEYLVDGDRVAAIFWAEGIAKGTGKPFKSEVLRLIHLKTERLSKSVIFMIPPLTYLLCQCNRALNSILHSVQGCRCGGIHCSSSSYYFILRPLKNKNRTYIPVILLFESSCATATLLAESG